MTEKRQRVRVDFEMREDYIDKATPNREKVFAALLTGFLADIRIYVKRVEFLNKEADEQD